MSEAKAAPASKERSASAASAPSASQAVELHTEFGVTTIDSSVVGKIASVAAQEVEGVARLGGTVSAALARVVRRIRGDEHQTTGVGVEVGQRQAAADLTVVARYPVSIPDMAESIRQNVISRVESLTGLEVVEVNIAVIDLEFPGGEEEIERRVT